MLEIQEYYGKKKQLYEYFLHFIDKEDECNKEEESFFAFFRKEQIEKSKEDLKSLIQLLLNISNHHKRNPVFFTKIEKIISNISKEMMQFFSKEEIFNFFKNNKCILFFLIKNKFLILDESICESLLKIDDEIPKFSYFFYPELKAIVSKEKLKNDFDENVLSSFDEKRQIGENDSYLCKLIRNDLIEEFIAYVNQNCIPLTSKISPSIFETHLILMQNEVTLLEYATFFGSMQIIQYLKMNNIDLSSSMWIYAIHSRKPELIHFLEENSVFPVDETYKECYKESIKCYHNEISNYIKENLLKSVNDDDDFYDNISSYGFEFHNYQHFPPLEDKKYFYYAVQFDYFDIVKLFVKNKMININEMIVYTSFFNDDISII